MPFNFHACFKSRPSPYKHKFDLHPREVNLNQPFSCLALQPLLTILLFGFAAPVSQVCIAFVGVGGYWLIGIRLGFAAPFCNPNLPSAHVAGSI